MGEGQAASFGSCEDMGGGGGEGKGGSGPQKELAKKLKCVLQKEVVEGVSMAV